MHPQELECSYNPENNAAAERKSIVLVEKQALNTRLLEKRVSSDTLSIVNLAIDDKSFIVASHTPPARRVHESTDVSVSIVTANAFNWLANEEEVK